VFAVRLLRVFCGVFVCLFAVRFVIRLFHPFVIRCQSLHWLIAALLVTVILLLSTEYHEV
jgi:hypothetical protein